MQNSEVLFRDKPIWQAIFSLVGPSILSVLVMVIYNMTDLFFINLLQDTAQTAAVSVVSPVFTLASAGAPCWGWAAARRQLPRWAPATGRMCAPCPACAAGAPFWSARCWRWF